MTSPRLTACLLLGLALAGCASLRAPEPALPPESVRGITPFSGTSGAATALPGGWQPWRLSRLKRTTDYALVSEGGVRVVKARAEAAASGLVHRVDVDPREFPVLQWRWKVPALIDGADNGDRAREDSPVRVIVSFDGDKSRLSLQDRVFFDQVRLLTGHDMPYATLMYIWENRKPRDTVVPNRHTGRVRMVVAESGPDGVGRWRTQARNVHQDFRRAFGEEPGRITSIAIMTDTDNTGATAEAWYGDIVFLCAGDRPDLALPPPRASDR